MQAHSVRIPLAAVALVLSLAGVAAAGDAQTADQKGKMIYTSRCSFCHGATGKGDGPAGAVLKPPATDFTNPAFWKTATPETIKTVIENGKSGTAMVSFKTSLNPEQIADLIAHLQTFKPQR